MSPAARPFGPSLSRRAVLAGGAATLLLAACGSDSSSGDKPTTTAGDDTDGAGPGTLVSLFPQSGFVVAKMPQRITFGLADQGGAMLNEGPANLDFTVQQNRKTIMEVSSAFHNEGIPRGYYPLELTLPSTGTYTAVASVDGKRIDAAFEVVDESPVPQVGEVMPVFDTPTTSDARGVDPICTADPPCALHADDLRATLAAKKPTALLVGTPAYCQVQICGPVLDVLLAEQPSSPGVTCIHAEVYQDGSAAAEDIQNAQLTDAVDRLGLTYEPALFVIGADGKLSSRLDSIYDQAELRRALEKVTA
jgi:hypothetical protein